MPNIDKNHSQACGAAPWLSEEKKDELKVHFKSLGRSLKDEIVFHLFYKQGLSKTKIAEKCGTSVSAISQRIKNLSIMVYEGYEDINQPLDLRNPQELNTEKSIKKEHIYAPGIRFHPHLQEKNKGFRGTTYIPSKDSEDPFKANRALLQLKNGGKNSDEIFQRLKEYHLGFNKEELEAYFKVASAIEGSVFPLLPEFSDL